MSERIIYNRRKLENLSVAFVEMEHPEWTKEQCREEGLKEEKIEELIRYRMTADLSDKLYDEGYGNYFGLSGCRARAKRIIERAPKELYQNINEYIDGRELSDVQFNGVTVKEIMTQFEPECSIDFYSVAEFIGLWSRNDYANQDEYKSFFKGSFIRFSK